MTRTTNYRQCRLRKKLETSIREQTSYLPQKFAVVGKVLKLQGKGRWEDGWVVEWVGEMATPEALLPDPHQDRKKHRKATGDALPKERPQVE